MSLRTRVVAVLAALVGALLVVPPADAASHAGALAVKGPGSVYTGTSTPSGIDGDVTYISQAVGAGATASYGVQVFNTGSQAAQFRLKVQDISGPARRTDLYAGSLLLTKLAASPDGYHTNPIAPGKSQVLTLKVVVPAGTPQATLLSDLRLEAVDGALIDTARIYTHIKAPAVGPHVVDVFARQGSQSFVGGTDADDIHVASSPAIGIGTTATFNVKVTNHLPEASPIGMFMFSNAECSVVTVKDNGIDVTTSIIDNTYVTPITKAGGVRNLTVAVKRVTSGCGRAEVAAVYVFDLFTSPTVTRGVALLIPHPYA